MLKQRVITAVALLVLLAVVLGSFGALVAHHHDITAVDLAHRAANLHRATGTHRGASPPRRRVA